MKLPISKSLNLFVYAVLFCCSLTSATAAHAEVVRTGYTTIVSANSGKCLSIGAASTSPGEGAIQWSCSSTSDQEWTVVAAGQSPKAGFNLVEQHTAQCLGVSGNYLDQETCTTGLSQIWTLQPSGKYFQFVNQQSGLCASVQSPNTYDGALIIPGTCSTATSMLWSFTSGLFTPTSPILLQADHSGQCLAIYGNFTQPGTALVQYPCDGNVDKNWQLHPVNGSYQLLSTFTNLCATVSGTGTSATVVEQTCATTPAGLWKVSVVGGAYQLASQSAGLCMSVTGASQAPLAALGLAACGSGLNGLWSLSAQALPSAWSPVISLPVGPTAIANLPNGQIMTWAALGEQYFDNDIGNSVSQTYTSIFDPIALTSSETLVSNTGDEMFCPGTANLKDGRILVNGGSSSPKTSIFNPSTGGWVADASMNVPRGYEGDTPLSNGSVMTLGGSWSGGTGGKTAEVWTNGAGWRLLPNVPETNIIGPDPGGITNGDNHLWLFAQANGTVFHAGPSAQMNWITTAGAGSITSAGNRGDDSYAVNGNATMYDVGMIMKTGGAPAYTGAVAEAGTYLININNPTVAVSKIAPMAYPRAFANSVILPNGQVVITGGQTYAVPQTDTTAVLTPEIWDPQTQIFRQLKPMQTPRTYHSTAILLQDGRVFVGGGCLCALTPAENHSNVEILTPPYLLNADGTPATRPVISQAPSSTAALGETISVQTSAPVVSFVLMRLSSTTHTVNNDQRRIPLQQAPYTSGNLYTLYIPSSSGVVLPGYYWLFAINDQGVPSVGSTILIN